MQDGEGGGERRQAQEPQWEAVGRAIGLGSTLIPIRTCGISYHGPEGAMVGARKKISGGRKQASR